MSYDFCCIYCGKKLNQKKSEGVEAAAYDISPVLSGGRSFSQLKFRVTEAQVSRWAIAPGEFGEGKLKPAAVFGIMSQPYNHDRREIASLTLDDMLLLEETALEMGSLGGKGVNSRKEEGTSVLDGEEEQKKNKKDKDKSEERTQALAREREILKLFQSSNVKSESDEAETGIKPELRSYYFNANSREEQCITFEIKRIEQNGVTTELELRQDGRTLGRVQRICPICGKRIPEQAGMVPHRMVGFIANPRAGKTSTIIALSQYMEKASAGLTLNSPIWHGCRTIPELTSTCTPIMPQEHDEVTDQFWKDMGRFEKGLPPQKTQAIVYNPTFYVEDREKKHLLLTLADIPGEYCQRKGDENPNTKEVYKETKIDRDAMQKRYQIILNCDAYITCFDISIFEDEKEKQNQSNWNIYLHAPVIWANQIQRLRNEVYGKPDENRFVPIMVLLTKCKELEENFSKQAAAYSTDPLENTYMFAKDYKNMMPKPGVEATDMQKITKEIMNTFNNVGEMNNAYFAMLRCSPFGFAAKGYDSEDEINNDGQTPTPKNIDNLMRWILRITGSIPTTGRYDPETGEDNSFDLPDRYYADPQYRSVAPKDDNEALLRNVLFVNPGYFDRKQTQCHPKGFWFERLWFRFCCIFSKPTNLKEEKA